MCDQLTSLFNKFSINNKQNSIEVRFAYDFDWFAITNRFVFIDSKKNYELIVNRHQTKRINTLLKDVYK